MVDTDPLSYGGCHLLLHSFSFFLPSLRIEPGLAVITFATVPPKGLFTVYLDSSVHSCDDVLITALTQSTVNLQTAVSILSDPLECLDQK